MEKENMTGEQNNKNDKQAAGMFIPGGVILGMGIGFLIDNVSAGMFIGLGAGFILFAVVMLFKK